MIHDDVAILRTWNRSDKAEEGFVYGCWLNSYRRSPNYSRMPSADYYAWYRSALDRLFTNNDTNVYIIESKSHPGMYIGFVCMSRFRHLPVLHYVFVKGGKVGGYRQLGFAKWALQKLGINSESKLLYTSYVPALVKRLQAMVAHAEFCAIEEFLQTGREGSHGAIQTRDSAA